MKIFDTQRTSTQTVTNKNTTPTDLGISFVACTNLSTISGEQRIAQNVTKSFPGSDNHCFRQSIKRWTGADTNGWLPGNGTTDVTGTITW